MARPSPVDEQQPATAPAHRLPVLARLNSRGFRLIMIGDLGVLVVALVLPMIVRHGVTWPSYSATVYGLGYAAIVILHIATLYFSGLYERKPRLGSNPELPVIVRGIVGAILLVALAELLTGAFIVPRGNLPIVGVFAVAGIVGNRALAEKVRLKREGPPRVLLVGTPDDVTLARRHLDDTEYTAEIVGTLTGPEGLPEAVEANRATDVLLVSSGGLGDLYPEPLTSLEARAVGVLQRVSARDTLLGLTSVREIGGMPFTRLRTHALPISRARAKRVLELALLLVTAPITVPLVVLLAIYVRLVAGSPVLYHQSRVGRGGHIFQMVKFRTMHRDAEAQGEVIIATRHDPRVVRGCGWLRATRLDELPQLWHVLTGEMSLVGPRPERPELTASYEAVIPGYARRHEIAPGITGLAQIEGRYHTDPSYKLGYDLQYLINWSPVLDLQILLRTVWVVLARKL